MPGLEDIPPDALAGLATKHLSLRDVASLSIASRSLRDAIYLNERLWHRLSETCFPVAHKGLGEAVCSWRSAFLESDWQARQCRTVGPAVREWSIDSNPIALAHIYGAKRGGGERRLVLTAQANVLELRQAHQSWQCFGHTGRVTCAMVLPSAASGAQGGVGILSAAADQTLKLWSASSAGGDDEELDTLLGRCTLQPRITLLTPTRNLRGHQEGITSLHLISGSSGVTIAASGAKDRTVRLWGLAPLLPSPVHRPQIAVLRGHGAPVTCLTLAGTTDSPQLVSGSLDGRVTLYDVYAPATLTTVKCAGGVSHVLPWDEHSVLAASRGAVQLVDLRAGRAHMVARPPAAAQHICSIARCGADVAVGGADAARVWDARGASDAPGAAAERLRLVGHSGPVTSIHVDQAKIVSATSSYGEAVLRVWCSQTGECTAALGSALEGNQQPADAQGPGDGDGGWDHEPGWTGVTALAVRGSLVLTGNAEGTVCERDFSRGQLPEAAPGGSARVHGPSKFWQGLLEVSNSSE